MIIFYFRFRSSFYLQHKTNVADTRLPMSVILIFCRSCVPMSRVAATYKIYRVSDLRTCVHVAA